MSDYVRMHYKETHPQNTVCQLKTILKECGIELEEVWPLNSSINTYSIRVQIPGTSIGANGKGVTQEYACASGYAEFFERFQNSILGHNIPDAKMRYRVANDEVYLSSKQLLNDNNSFISYLYSEVLDLDRQKNISETSVFEKLISPDSINNDEKKYLSLPFYSTRDQKVVYLPYGIYSPIYGSNGMCAGNTPAEALVQGLSEIVERVVQRRIFLEKPTFPDIPESYIKSYPYIYEMYKKIAALSDYGVVLKDCSFGGLYPVVALCIIEKNTGRYGIKLGCHPNIGIAMERTFTEITQGIDIYDYCKSRSWLDFSNTGVESESNISNSFKVGQSQYPYQFFKKKPSYQFVEFDRFSEKSNDEILKEWLGEFIPDYDVLIRDVSYTGFPSYHIIIPGLSEMFKLSEYDFRVYNTRLYVSSLLLHPEGINEENIKYVIGILKHYKNSIFENSLNSYIPPDISMSFPFDELGATDYLLAMCYVIKRQYAVAKEYIDQMYRRSNKATVSETTKAKISCIHQYISGMCAKMSHLEVMEILHKFYDTDLCQYIDDIFQQPELVIRKQYLNIEKTRVDTFNEFREKISDKYKETIINQNSIEDVLF